MLARHCGDELATGPGPLRCRRQHLSGPAVGRGRLPRTVQGPARIHTESDLRGYLNWCESHDLDPLAATRSHIDLYVRWLQEVRRARKNLGRHPNYLLAAYRPPTPDRSSGRADVRIPPYSVNS